MEHRSFNILGNIAVVNFPKDFSGGSIAKKKFAEKILRENKSITTVLEKSGNFSGRLRKMKTKFLAGEKTKEVLYHENGCVLRFNIDGSYFSPRLSNERGEIASLIKENFAKSQESQSSHVEHLENCSEKQKNRNYSNFSKEGDEVLVMFAGVGPFSIVIAKNSKAKKVYSNEINREANKYAKLNIELNKLKNKVELLPGDIKRIAGKIKKKFDVIVMPRPQLKESFLKEAFVLSKKGTRIFYYDFCRIEEKNLIVEKIKNEAKKFKKKIKILNVKDAGEIAPYKVRVRVDFEII